MKEVAPTPDILDQIKNGGDRTQYVQRYQVEVLDRLIPYTVYQRIQEISEGNDVALCCYEKPGDFCHRHMLARWLGDRMGIDIDEYDFSKNAKAVSYELF